LAAPLVFEAPVSNELPVMIQFPVQVGVLASAILVYSFLLIHFTSESLDEADVRLNSALVIIVHATSVFIQSTKLSLKSQELVL
jgi:hypothetical protein